MALLLSERIRLRAIEPEDLDLLYAWENDSSLWDIGTTKSPYSRYVLKEYISQSHQNIYELRQLRLMIERRDISKTVGIIDLFDFDPHNKRAGVGILVNTQYQGQGIASESMALLMDYAFSFLDLHQLYAHVAITNYKSLSLFRKCGFNIVGTLKEWTFSESGFSDVMVLQCFSSCQNDSLSSK